MNQSTDVARQTDRFGEAVQAFTPICTSRYAKLMPFKDGTAELREKGALYRLIRELMATVGVSVAPDTIDTPSAKWWSNERPRVRALDGALSDRCPIGRRFGQAPNTPPHQRAIY